MAISSRSSVALVGHMTKPVSSRGQNGSKKTPSASSLRSDPAALRKHLWNWRAPRLGNRASLSRLRRWRSHWSKTGELVEAERRALLALGAMFADPLRLELAEGEPTPDRQVVLDKLADHQGARQLEGIEELARRFGEGPALRKARGPQPRRRAADSGGGFLAGASRRPMTDGPVRSRSGCARLPLPSCEEIAYPDPRAGALRTRAVRLSPSAATSVTAGFSLCGSPRRKAKASFDRDLRASSEKVEGGFPSQGIRGL